MPTETHNLVDVRADVRAIEAEYKLKGVPLSGRVIHVCHYLPLSVTYNANTDPSASVISPPATPPIKPADVEPTTPVAADSADSEVPVPITTSFSDDDIADPAPESANKSTKWHLNPRYGHSAMTSGIRSLSVTHDQVVIGWPGDILAGVSSSGEKRLYSSLSEEDRVELEAQIGGYVPDGDKEKEGVTEEKKPIKYVPVWVDDKVAHGHYDGYCKTTLWPLFHYLLWQDVAYELSASTSTDAAYAAYASLNHAFAKRIAQVYQPGDLIWVHDYHLLLVPKMLRAMHAHGDPVAEATIGLFVHTPFPSSEIFRCLPRRKEILDGMLGANLVCFQTYSYARHFISSCIRVCGYESSAQGIDNQGHITTVKHCAVGVDADRVARDILRPGIQPKLQALRALYQNKKIIVGRDKLDVVKGVLQKLRAFEKLLTDYPEWIGNVVLIQVTSPALSDSPKLERQISELVAHINGEFGSLDFIPVHHYHQTIKEEEFYALLSIADLAVITPLRDGMNTTSMEYVIAQERTKKSPLVLSEFMGISNTMADALQINPWDLGDVAAAINRGLLMSDNEKATRHAKLHQVVTTHTSHTWAAQLVKLLLQQIAAENTAHATPFLDREKLKNVYESAGKRLFLFDYDGTLTPIVKTPSMAVPSSDALKALTLLAADPRNVVWIISGRDGEFLEQHLGHVKGLGMSAEHGGFMRDPGQEKWSNLTEELDMSWMAEVKEVFKYYTERTTGSHIEIKKSSITWHYRASDPEWGQFQCRQCQDLLENNLVHKRPIEVLVGKKNLEVRPIAVNKGEIVKRIFYNNPDSEFVFCAGDDKTDEDMFRALAPYTASTNQSLTMKAPASIEALNKGQRTPPVELSISPDGVFSTAVGASSKKTLASWHVTTPFEVIESVLDLVGEKPVVVEEDE